MGALLSFYLNWNYVDMAARLILDKLRQEEGSDIENSHLLEAHFREDESAGSDLGIRFEYATSPPWSSHCPALNVLCPPQMRHDLQDRQFYMKQSYQDPTDADGAYYTKHSIANHTLSASPHSDPHSDPPSELLSPQGRRELHGSNSLLSRLVFCGRHTKGLGKERKNGKIFINFEATPILIVLLPLTQN